MFSIPYRWRPRTIIPNLISMFYDIYYGIGNIIRWVPVIWHDKDYDWGYLAHIMEYKLRRMSALFKNHRTSVSADRDAKRMLICAVLLKRLQEDNYYKDSDYKKESYRIKYDQEYCFKLMGKYFDCWWD